MLTQPGILFLRRLARANPGSPLQLARTPLAASVPILAPESIPPPRPLAGLQESVVWCWA
jgi:hypothetical protein